MEKFNNLKLIKNVERYPVLWRKVTGGGSIHEKQLWKIISDNLNKGVAELKKRWGTIRSVFLLRQEQLRSGVKNYEKRYERYDMDLRFLLDAEGDQVESYVENEEDQIRDGDNFHHGRDIIANERDPDLVEEENDSQAGEDASDEVNRDPEFDSEVFKTNLIDIVRIRPVLWDPTNEDFEDKALIDRIWREIGLILGTRPSICSEIWFELKKKWDNEMRSGKPGSAGPGLNSKGPDPRLDFLKKAKVQTHTKTNMKPESLIPKKGKLRDIEIVYDIPEEPPAPKKRICKADVVMKKIEEYRKNENRKIDTVYIDDDESERCSAPEHSTELDSFMGELKKKIEQFPPILIPQIKFKISTVMTEMESRMACGWPYQMPAWNMPPPYYNNGFQSFGPLPNLTFQNPFQYQNLPRPQPPQSRTYYKGPENFNRINDESFRRNYPLEEEERENENYLGPDRSPRHWLEDY